MGITLRFEGGQELAAALAGLKARVSKRVQKEALLDAAEPIRAQAARLAPRAPGAPDIADHIVVGSLRGGIDEFGDAKAEAVAVGPEKPFFYGRYLELGTVKMSARPFLRPAFEANAQKALDMLSRSLWRELAAVGVGRSSTGVGPAIGGPGGSSL